MRVVFIGKDIASQVPFQIPVIASPLWPNPCCLVERHGDEEVPIGCAVDVASPVTILLVLAPLHQIGWNLVVIADIITMGKVVIQQLVKITRLCPTMLTGRGSNVEPIPLTLGKGNGLGTVVAGIDKGPISGLGYVRIIGVNSK